MTREEAIEVYNGLINTKIKEAFEFFAPELREINEEEIRKDIIGGLMWQRDNLKSEGPHDNNLILPGFCLNVGKHLKYLEKQKEPHYTKRNALFDKCVEDCDPEVMKEVSNKVDEMLGKEKKPNYCHHDVAETGWTEDYRKGFYDGWNNCNIQHSLLKEEHFEYPIGINNDGKVLYDIPKQKPAWSEELDIDTLREWSMRYAPDIRQAIESTAYHFYNLRPHWKPSDHQMNILKAVKEYVGRGSGYWGEGLGSLIEDLEKLM